MNPSKGKISVIIPVYNETSFLEETLESVGRQTYTDYEVILVNDGSGAAVSRILLEFCKSYPFAQMLELDQHQGVSGARNRGVEQAKGLYLHFLDSDDRIAPKWFEKAIHRFGESDAEVVTGKGTVFSTDETSTEFKRQRDNFEYLKHTYGSKPISHWGYFLVYSPPIHAMIFKRSVFQSHRFPEDLSYGEDRWLWLKMRLDGVRFESIEYIGAYYRLSSSTNGKKAQRQQAFFEKLVDGTMLSDTPSRTYAYTFLLALSLRTKSFGQFFKYLTKCLTNPFSFINQIRFLRRLRH